MKNKVKLLIVFLILFFSSSFFLRTPFHQIFFKIQFLLEVLLSLFTVYVLAFFVKKGNERILLFFAFLMFLPTFLSTIRAYQVFGQPFFYGFLSERRWLVFGFSFLLYFLLVKKLIDFKTVEKGFLLMAFFSLFFFVAFYLIAVFFPQWKIFLGSAVKFLYLKGMRVKLDSYFLVFGAIYFFIRFYIKKVRRDLFLFVLFLLSIALLFKGRIVLLVLLFVLCLFLLIFFGKEGIRKTLVFVFWLFFAAATLELTGIGSSGGILLPYKIMLKSVMGETNKDSSIDARREELLTAINFMYHNPSSYVFGAGRLSKKWKGGYERLLGWFFPLDIGFIGVVFVYGLLGTLLVFIMPLYIGLKAISKIGENKVDNVFILSLAYMLVFVVIQAFFAARMVFRPYTFALPFFVILAYFNGKGISLFSGVKSNGKIT